MAKKKKNVQQRRQKKMATQKKKRTTKGGLPGGGKQKQIKQQDMMRIYQEMQDPDKFMAHIDKLSFLLKGHPFFNRLRVDKDKLKTLMIDFYTKYQDKINDWETADFSQTLSREVINPICDFSFKMKAFDIMERAAQSSSFDVADRDSVLFGHMLTMIEQQMNSLDNNLQEQIKDFQNPLWFICFIISFHELGEEDTDIDEIHAALQGLIEQAADQIDEDGAEPGEAEDMISPLEMLEARKKVLEDLDENELELIEQTFDLFDFTFELDEILHAPALPRELQNVDDYIELQALIGTDPQSELYRHFSQAITDDFTPEVAERFEAYFRAEEAAEPEVAAGVMNMLRERTPMNNPIVINHYLMSLKDWLSADDDYARAIFTQPDEIMSYLQFADHLKSENNLDRAIRAYRRASEIDREDYRPYRGLSQCFEAQQYLDRAAEYADMAVDFAEQALNEELEYVTAEILEELKNDLERIEDQL